MSLVRDNYAVLIQRNNQSSFQGSYFGANVQGELSQDDLVTERNGSTNTNVSVEVPPDAFGASFTGCMAFDRFLFSVYITNTLFLTPETNCDVYAIGSVIVTVDVNGCSDLVQEIELDFQELDQVLTYSVTCIHSLVPRPPQT